MIFFIYPADICNAVYIINMVGLFNSVIRVIIKKRNVFLIDDLVFNIL